MLANSLFGAAKLIKISDPEKYFYLGFGAWFDVHKGLLLADGSELGKDAMIRIHKCIILW